MANTWHTWWKSLPPVVESTFGYIPGYAPHSVATQVSILRHYFPELRTASENLAEGPLHLGAEAWFAIPRWQSIASTYGEALHKILSKIGEAREGRFKNSLEEKAGLHYPQCMRQVSRTADAFDILAREQTIHGKPCDVLSLAAQFGKNYRGCSHNYVYEVMNPNEFGLDSFAIGSMLLTHSERLTSYGDLGASCIGDEFVREDINYPCTPFFYHDVGRIEFFADFFRHGNYVAVPHFGAPTGYL